MADEQLTLQNYMTSRPAAVTPASTEDVMLILQGGVVRKIPANQLAKLAILSGESEPPDNAVGAPGEYYFCPVGDYNLYGPKLGDNTWDPASVRSLKGDKGDTGETGLTGNPYKTYATLAAANSDLATIPADALVWINADATASNIGFWAKTGGVLVQSSFDRVALVENRATVLENNKANASVGQNLFNIAASDIAVGYYANATTGALSVNALFNATGFIPVVAGQTYTLSYKHQIAWYNSAKVFISGSGSADTNKTQIAPTGAAFLRCTSDVPSWTLFQVVIGAVAKAFASYEKGVDLSTALRGSLTTEQVANGFITGEKTAFFAVGKNLFNPADADFTEGVYINSVTGVPTSLAGYNGTGFIPVVAGQAYTLSYKHQIAWYNSAKVFISGSGSADLNRTQTAPVGAAFLRCTVTDAPLPTFQVEVGSAVTEYSPYSYGIDLALARSNSLALESIPKGLIVPEKTSFLKVGKNKFNIAAPGVILGKYISYQDGIPAVNASFNATDFIPVTGGQTYAMSYVLQLAWYDASKKFISGTYTPSVYNQTAPESAAFLRCSVGVDYWLNFQVEEGDVRTSWESFGWEFSSTGDGFPIRLPGAAAASCLAIAPVQYVSIGKEIALYLENVAGNWPESKGKVGITFTGGKETGAATKLTPQNADLSPIAGTVKIASSTMVLQENKTFNLVISNPATVNPVVIHNIGDSITLQSMFTNAVNKAPSSTGLSFVGNRDSTSADTQVAHEGHGGWSTLGFVTVDHAAELSPFMQPVTAGYKYYGLLAFWISANLASPPYPSLNMDRVKTLFNPATGRLLSPAVGDIMGTSPGVYEQWDGGNWVSIASATFGGFAFSYAKYRSVWGITQPNIVHILLGTNDFSSSTPLTFNDNYVSYSTRLNTIITSIHADSPLCKIVIGIPPSSGRQGTAGTYTTEVKKKVLFLLANALVAGYGGREEDLIYLVDYHSVVDREFGFSLVAEPPFEGYTGVAEGTYTGDTTHPADGADQMATAYMGIIQALR